MTETTYGDHAEHAADLFTHLIRTGHHGLPETSQDRFATLAARQIILDCLLDRVHHHLMVPRDLVDPDHNPRRITDSTTRVPLRRLATDPVRQLARHLHALPQLAPHSRRPPTEVLAVDDPHPIVHIWMLAAREVLAANHTLDTAPRPLDVKVYWALAGDTADLAESVMTLDEHTRLTALDEHISLVEEQGPEPQSSDSLARRVAAAHLSRMGRWYGQHAALDPTIRGASMSAAPRPLLLVRTPAELAPAQRHLGRLIARTARPHRTSSPHLDAELMLQVASNQARLVRRIRGRLERITSNESPTLRAAAVEAHDDLGQLGQDLDTARNFLRRLYNPHPDPLAKNVPAVNQLSELMAQRNMITTASTSQALEIAAATQEVVGTWAHGILNSVRRGYHSELRLNRIDEESDHPRPRVIKFDEAEPILGPLAYHHRADPTSALVAPKARRQLRETLDATAPRRNRGGKIQGRPEQPDLGR